MKIKSTEIETKASDCYHQSQTAETKLLPNSKSLQNIFQSGCLPLNERFTLEWNSKQWILKKHVGNKNSSFCTTKKALIRCLGKDYPDDITPEALGVIGRLPETFREWLLIASSPLKGEEGD